jgi:hypothetical protein
LPIGTKYILVFYERSNIFRWEFTINPNAHCEILLRGELNLPKCIYKIAYSSSQSTFTEILMTNPENVALFYFEAVKMIG